MRVKIIVLLVASLLFGADASAAAQQAPPQPASGGARAIRAEYASVLLRSKRYREAAAEYRKLVASDRNNVQYRLGLARALAWGEQHREAESELRWLASRRPRDRDIAEMLRSVRASFAPTVREAEGWVRGSASHAPYRLALARALVREGKASAALPHYAMLVHSSRNVSLLREAAAAHSRARDRHGAVSFLRRATQLAPADRALQLDYARALAAAGDRREAVAQYDALVSTAPAAELLLERGRLQASMRKDAEAERDINAALALEPSAAAYVAQGDLYRWRGEFTRARDSYGRARARAPSDRAIANRLADLSREERPALASPLGVADQRGWQLATEFLGDNAGFRYGSLRTRAGFAFAGGAVLSVGAEQRRIGIVRSASSAYINGFGGDVGVTLASQHGRLSGRMGAMQHAGVSDVPFGNVTIAGWWRAWSAALDLSGGPAYPSLSTFEALSPPPVDAAQLPEPLRANQAALTVTGALGPVDLALIAEGTRLSDGNDRTTIQTRVRYPLSRRASAVYGVSDIKFRERSELYWDPYRYTAHGLGLEYATARDRGVIFRARGLAGFARSLEPDSGGTVPATGVIAPTYDMHMSSEGELGYRGRRWEAVLGAAYGRGRSNGYQRFGGTAFVRIVP
jgi:tetratricopeptide (TPR) repeat protein